MVGRAVAAKLSDLGHEPTVGTRDAQATLTRTEPDAMGNPAFSTWHAEHPAVRLATFAEAAEQTDLVVNATNGGVSLEVLNQAGARNLDGKVLLDIANPLDFSQGFPPTLFVKDTDSLGEQIQRAFPDTKVVKALNTMTAALMVEPGLAAGGDHSVFVSGNDEAAKDSEIDLLKSLGHTDVIDLGDLSTARGTEMLLPIWLRLMGALGTPMFNFKIAR
jgi:predicted dinucleotide-binding enzyme